MYNCIRSNPVLFYIESCSVQSNRALIGLHKEVMSLSTLRTPSRDDDQQIYVSSTGEICYSSYVGHQAEFSTS